MMKKKMMIVFVLVMLVGVIFSGCNALNEVNKGTYNEKLSIQYARATQYKLTQGQLMLSAGYGYSVYLASPNKVNIYGHAVVQNQTENFVKSVTIDDNGVIDIGWKPATVSVLSEWNKNPMPPNGDVFYLYSNDSALENRGYNVIIYKRNVLQMSEDAVDSQYAIVEWLGVFLNGELKTYRVPY